jgi:anti-anti-sigma regulatory factor
MLRITVNDAQEAFTIKLEGRVVGPLAYELDRTWQSLAGSLGEKKLRVDLCGVTQADVVGRHVLANIHQTIGAEFLADTPLTKFLAQEAHRQSRVDEKEN